MKYVIISSAYNEEKYIEYTLKSVCSQTLKPEQWIIVNDGSIDGTKEIVDRYVKKYSWIKLINNKINEKREVGSKVVRAFYVGYDSILEHNYDFLVKLDADLTLPDDYFKNIAKCFREETDIGICGGMCVSIKEGRLLFERNADYHIRGALKAYRSKCFLDIGGLKPVLGWDGIDEMRAMYFGWKLKVLPLNVIHHRVTGKETGQISVSYMMGQAVYRIGYDIFLAILRAIIRGTERPYVINGIVFLAGYIKALLECQSRITEPEIIKFIREYHYSRVRRYIKNFIFYA